MLTALEAVVVNVLFLECADHALDHAFLLRAVQRDELLAKAVAADQGREVATGKNELIE